MRYRRYYIILTFILLIIAILSIFIGRYNVGILDIFKMSDVQFESFKQVVIAIRLPRIIAGIIIGSALSVVGATFQAVFRNPLVSADILGASSASAFGIALCIILHLGTFTTMFISFWIGLFAVVISYLLSTLFKSDRILGLILSGIMVSTVFSSLLSYIKLIADTDNELPDITYWLMGKLSSIEYKSLSYAIFPILTGMIIIFVLRWRINLFTIGENEARTMGMNVDIIKAILVLASTLITVTVVSLCGIIGFVGLIIPHFGRMLIGYNNRVLIPVSILGGSIFLLLVDDLARTLSTYEIPIGILTSIIGAPTFIFLLLRKSNAEN